MKKNCTCGHVINDDDYEYSTGVSDEKYGDDYFTIAFKCTACNTAIEFDEWGSCDTDAEKVEYIVDRITIAKKASDDWNRGK